MELVGRFLRGTAVSFFLFGPRGTAKSTWLRAARHDAIWLDLLEPEAQRLSALHGQGAPGDRRHSCLPCEEFLAGLHPERAELP